MSEEYRARLDRIRADRITAQGYRRAAREQARDDERVRAAGWAGRRPATDERR